MKLSQYARQHGISYKTAWRWYKAGQLDAYQNQTPTGTVIVRDPVQQNSHTGRVALYARVSSLDQKEDLTRQLNRLQDYAAARGYHVSTEVTEIASGLNDQRPKLLKLLSDTSIGTLVVEKRERLTRFGSHYIETLLAVQGRSLDIVFSSDTGSPLRSADRQVDADASLQSGTRENELVDDFVSVITSMAARIYGRRQSKRRAEKIRQCVEAVMQSEEE